MANGQNGKSEVDEILDALEQIYGEQVVSKNLSSQQAAIDRLGDRIWQAIKHGRVRLTDATKTIEVAKPDFVLVPKARYGATCYGRNHVGSRRISQGEEMYFARSDGNRESVNLCKSCGAPHFERQGGLF